ncbi:MAG: hypothetical protein H6741_31495 [Alphaproteobacteria bacterium]|nr:hypothetical protein [Alphaproteobacteria bacterium]
MRSDDNSHPPKRPEGASKREGDQGSSAFTEIAEFLNKVGFGSLFEYFDLATTADAEEVRGAMERRRRWAQSQQSNPKHQEEARWLIRNQALVRMVLLERRAAYLRQLERRRLSKNLEVLSLFARGAMATGVLTDAAEQAVLNEAKALGVPEAYAQRLVLKLSEEMKVTRQASAGNAGRDRMVVESLIVTVREVIAQGTLSADQVNAILAEGKRRGLDEQAIRAVLEQAAQRGAAKGESNAGAKQDPLDAQLKSDAIREIVDTVRGAMLQGILGMSTIRSVQRRGVQLGLDARTVELLVAEATRAGEQAMRGELDPYAVFNVSPTADHDTLREAYQRMRQWALGLPTQGEAYRACVLLDMAWTLVRTPVMQSRYNARRASS